MQGIYFFIFISYIVIRFSNCYLKHDRYFIKLDRQNATPLKSTWSMPHSFARLVRQQYT